MLQDGEKELIRRYALALLTDAEHQFVAGKIEHDAEWRSTYLAIKQQLEASAVSQSGSSDTGMRKPRKFVPGKKMITLMIIGWVLMAAAVIVVLIDMANRGTDRRKMKERMEVKDTLQ